MSAAGVTIPDVPTEISTSQLFTKAIADFQTSEGKSSPYQTTPGRNFPLHLTHRGGSTSPPIAEVTCDGGISAVRWHAKHFGVERLPWRCSTSKDPARSCKSSMFCVITETLYPDSASRLTARCAALGAASETCWRRHRYHPHINGGFSRKALAVSILRGSYGAQIPVNESPYVGTPLSAEIPAPVKTTISGAPDRAFAAFPNSGTEHSQYWGL